MTHARAITFKFALGEEFWLQMYNINILLCYVKWRYIFLLFTKQ